MNAKIAYYRTYQVVFKGVSSLLDWTPPELLRGAGSIKKLPDLIKEKGMKKPMIVTDQGLWDLGLLSGLLASLDEKGIPYAAFHGAQPNPTIDNVEECRKMYIDAGCDCFVAFGGGSSMDCAKGAAARMARPGKTIQQMRGVLKVVKKTPVVFAVPTTAGTGSETTLAAVITDSKTHEKFAINDPVLRPSYAVLDPELTIGLPPKITSTTGMDALTHAVEAYIGRSNTKLTESSAKDAVKLIFDNLEKAYNDGKDIIARENMLVASYLAGVAFTRAYVGYVHAIAHNLGGMYGVPHGLANAVILPYVLDYFGASAYSRLADLADVAGIGAGKSDAEKARDFIAEIRAMNVRMNIPDGFDCIKEEDIPTIVERALKEGNPLYPVPKIMDAKDCEAIIRRLIK